MNDAPEYKESQIREEAKSIVLKALLNDSIEALDIFSKDIAQMNEFVNRLRPLIISDEFLMNAMITNCINTYGEKILEGLDNG